MRATIKTILALLLIVDTAAAEAVRFEITQREPYAEGKKFGEVGSYEKIVGRVFFEIDPENERNASIFDLKLAERNERGRVEFSSDLFILAPKSLAKGNRAILYDVNNRGNKLALRMFNDASAGNRNRAEDPGHGFLMRECYTVVWSGWDGELLPGGDRLQLHAPVVVEKKRAVTGIVRYEMVSDKDDATRLQVGGANHGAYTPTRMGLPSASLTWRLRPGDPRVKIPRKQFQIHVFRSAGDAAGQLPKVELEIPSGFRKAYLYELTYQARDPLVHGVTFAAVRDLITALKNGVGESNPCLVEGKPVLERAHGFGVSQSGRYLREFLYWGFNQDEKNRRAFDGLIPHVAGGGLGSFNHRFAQPGAYVTQHQLHDWPTDRFPFTYGIEIDPLTGERDGILVRQRKLGGAPLVMHTQSSAEYWSRSGSLVHTDPLGRRDAKIPDTVRIFAFGGTQHGPSGFPPTKGKGQNLANPGDYRPFLRALLSALDEWSRAGTSPPASVYPRIDQKTLVGWRQAGTKFPPLPGVRYPEVIQQPPLLDFGARWAKERIIDNQPPAVVGHYRVLAAACDEDGNPRGCLSPPEVMAPLATYTGWNLRARDAGAENELVGLAGSYVPFPRTADEAGKRGDPRKPIDARYANLETYLKQLRGVCDQLVKQRYLLEEDVERTVERQRERAAASFAASAKNPAKKQKNTE